MGYRFITIGREFGSGGHKIGQMLSEQLGLAYYDNELLTLAAERGNLNEVKLAGYDEKKHNAYLYEVNYGGNENVKKGESFSNTLFQLQKDVILDISQRQGAIIVGRCADSILKEAGADVISVFICAPFDYRLHRTMELEGLDEKTVISMIRKKDKRRKSYYESRTGKKWGNPDSYDYCFNTGKQSFQEIANEIIKAYVKI